MLIYSMWFKRFYWLYKVDLPYRLGSIQNKIDKKHTPYSLIEVVPLLCCA